MIANTTKYNPNWVDSQQTTGWKCYLFGLGPTGIIVTRSHGKVPNWFWRKMQYLIFGNEWVKEKA